MTSHPEFGPLTTATEVATVFKGHIKDKTSKIHSVVVFRKLLLCAVDDIIALKFLIFASLSVSQPL
jgi:hypothetical protein